MRTMACVWFSVTVLVSIQKVYGNVCLKNANELSCDECMRCSGQWCNKRGETHCAFTTGDEWCPDDHELPHQVAPVTTPGVAVNPIYAERTLFVEEPNSLDIHYIAKTKQTANLTILGSTQNFNIVLKETATKCVGMNCTTTIEATPSTDFCNATSGISEYVDVRINFGLDEVVKVKYYVTCACECSQKVQRSSPFCSKNGNFSCGVCTCYPGWTGEYCNQTVCDEKRGDVVQCSINPRNDDDCSGNGYCGHCETCICYTDREGSQYFDKEDNCADLCMAASECEDCLLNHTIGECNSCINSMTIQAYNETLTEDRDDLNRKVWVTCNETIIDCRIDYVAKRTDNGHIYVMVVRSCNDVDAAAIIGGPKVSIILGVLGIVAAVAAVGGIMLWKHMNAVPPVPLNDPQYQNIDAEDCTGENPLYKPPTSSFKNPTYGKW